jgi:selenocysteine-specific elongation factor
MTAWHVVGTAGHVDHGKSTLVRDLTGTDPDRWAEEKARGLTIDLGFASTTLPSGRGVAFVDVPGHVRFLRNMLAGIGAVDACLFVVSTVEGWKPQSEEHLRIVELLGISHGVVALTMVDLVDDDQIELVRLDVEERVPSGWPIVRRDEVRAVLDDVLARTPPAADAGRARLWVDRSFAAKGSGTVVTGTLTGGTLRTGDEVDVGRPARIRSLQSHGETLTEVGPGRRVAVNLTGVAHDDVGRGDPLVHPGRWHRSDVVDATLTVLASLDHDVSRRGAHVAYLGSGEHPVAVRVIGGDRIAPGSTGLVRIRLPRALPLLPGDRFVLRESGRGETVGGGVVLDVAPVLPPSKARPDRSIERAIAERGWVDVDELERLTGERRAATVGRWVVDPAALAATRASIAERVDAAGALGLDLAALDERERAALPDDLVVRDGRVHAPGAADPLADHPWVAALAARPYEPPPPEGVPRDEVRELVRRGLVVEADGLHFAPSAIESATRALGALLASSPDGVTVAQVRDALGTTRKYLLPLLGHLDRTGVTRRRGEVRIAGPRL